ncbi:MAG: hypothetical protein ACLGI9_03860 [Thermoanaerobaculia bacterium]
MKRVCVLAALVCAIALALPTLSTAVYPPPGCTAPGYCKTDADCGAGGFCYKSAGQLCGRCG